MNYKLKDLMDKPENEWARTEDAHEAIIHKRDFDLAQWIMNLDTRTSPGGDKVYLFSGVLICGCCGSRMTRKTDRYKGKAYHYYYCPTGKKNGCVTPYRAKENELVFCMLDSVKSHISNVVSLETLLHSVDSQKAGSRLARQYEAQIAENEHQLEQIAGFKSALYENTINGIISKDDYKILKNKYTGDASRLQHAITGLRREHDNVLNNRSKRLLWLEHFKRFEGLTELDRKTVAHLIQNIRVTGKNELQITFNYQLEYEKAVAACAEYAEMEVA